MKGLDKMIQYCLTCNKPFYISNDNKNYKFFCSNDCLNNYISTHNCNIDYCKHCGKQYIFFNKNRGFCSTNCKRAFKRSKLVYTHTCLCCNNQFTSHYKDNNFCCRSCATTYTSRFHNMGYFIKNEEEWYNINHQKILPSFYTEPSTLMSQNDYFSGYYMDIHHEVRSGSEHNLCRLLQLCQIDYDYELYTFQLDQHKTYRPDIFILSENTFYEMKGEWRGDSYEKVQLFRKKYPSIKLIIIDMPTYLEIEKYAKQLFLYTDFNKHIRIKNQLIRHIPQFRHNDINYSLNELQYWFFNNKVDISLLKNPITLSNDLDKLIKPYRLNGKIYYAIKDNQYFYNEDDINQLKTKIKENIKVMIPSIINKEHYSS